MASKTIAVQPDSSQELRVFLTDCEVGETLSSHLHLQFGDNYSLEHGSDSVSQPQSPVEATSLSAFPINERIVADNAAEQRVQRSYEMNLHDAVCVNNIYAVDEWLEHNSSTDCNKTDEYGFTPLHYAAKFNRVDIFKKLENKADPTIKTTEEEFTALHLAARCKTDVNEGSDVPDVPPSEDIVHRLLKLPKVDVNAGDRYGVSPLHMACQCGNLEAVKNLVSHPKIEVNKKDKNGNTPLHEACLRGDTDVVIKLLEKMENVGIRKIDLSNMSGLTPLHLACREGHVNIVKLLLGHFTGLIKAKDVEGSTCLHLACQKSNTQVVMLLMKDEETKVTAINKDGLTPIHIAAQHGHCSVIEVLLEANHIAVDIRDTYSQTPMHFAAEYGQREMLELLYKKYGASLDTVDVHHYTPLLTAVEKGQTDAFQMLLNFSRPSMLDVVNMDGKSALFLAAEFNYLQIIEIILGHRLARKLCLATDTNLNTPLHIAAANGHLNVVVGLLEHKTVKPYAKNCLSKTALHLAAENGHTSVVKELLDDYNVKDVDQDGNTALHLACNHGYLDIVQLLVNKGADVESRNTKLWTPLGCAASKGHDKVIKLLIGAKAKVNPKDKSKSTPLHLASKEGHRATVNVLLQNHADVSCIDDNSFNALDWAIENGHHSVAKAFVESQHWKEALKNITSTRSGRMTTPFRKLIIKMPEIAEIILNKCTDWSSSSEGDNRVQPLEDCKVTFDFKILEDLQDFEKQLENDSESHTMKEEVNFSSLKKLKHPLTVMVESKRTELLKHPLVNILLDYKWNKYGRCLFSIMLAFHIMFVVLLTSFCLLLPSPLSNTCMAPAFNSTGVPVNFNKSLTNTTVEKAATFITNLECGQSSYLVTFLQTAAILIILMSVLRLVLECYQFTQLLQDYFSDLSNWVEVPLFIWSIISVLVLQYECLCPPHWQWQICIVALFLAWADLILFMRKMQLMDIGIYVLMFESIFKTFLKMIILTILLVVTFALAFYMAFHRFNPMFVQSPFASPFRSLIKTMTMTTGELDYESIFHYSSGGLSEEEVLEVPFPVVSIILWVFFLILMPILLANMLVGLAVDDIKGIQDAATLTRLALRVKLALSLEAHFSILSYIHRREIPLKLEVKISRQHRWLSWFQELINGEDFSSVEHISSTLNPSKTPLEQQTITLMNEMQKMQETLHMLTKSIQELKSQHKS